MVLKRTFVFENRVFFDLLGGGVFGYSLGSFRDGVFGQFSGEEKSDSGLDFPGGDGGPLVVVSKTGSLSGNPLKDVIDERIHDRHCLGGDTSVGVDLFQHLVDVDGIGLLPLGLLLLVSLGDGLGGLACLLGGLSGGLGGHVELLSVRISKSEW